MLQLKHSQSPNFNGRGDNKISMLVLHYTGMKTAQEAIDRLCNVEAQVSSHYVIDEDGTIYKLVDENDCAWHAGVSYWRGHKNVNNISVGIEIVNPGHEFGYRPFPDVQMQAVAGLCKDIISRHHIAAVNVVGHSDIAPQRKEDPGELFDWKWLAEQGIGLWPEAGNTREVRIRGEVLHDAPAGGISRSAIGSSIPPIRNPIKKLSEFGYETPSVEAAQSKVITAFQRHFRPSDINGVWDSECDEVLDRLIQMI